MSFRINTAIASNPIADVMFELLDLTEQQQAIEASRQVTLTQPIHPQVEKKHEPEQTWRSVTLDQQTGIYSFMCPHCDLWTEVPVNAVNCQIFRHAFFVQRLPNGHVNLLGQIPPHASKQVCDQLIEEERVVGCAKPFKFTKKPDGNYIAERCGYI